MPTLGPLIRGVFRGSASDGTSKPVQFRPAVMSGRPAEETRGGISSGVGRSQSSASGAVPDGYQPRSLSGAAGLVVFLAKPQWGYDEPSE